ncbi:MAG TPA: HEAT repeat domain-containing protein [Candidatus Polarisedimenticolia bacterium]|nr:HEAT repeat domain-containing protein [Candidatus Polarisedimenticolia bacterium]
MNEGATMSCETARRQMLLLLYEEIDPGERQRLLGHVRDCAACGEALAEERRRHALLAEARPVEAPDDLLTLCRQDLSALLEREAEAPAARHAWRWRLSPVFALSLLVVGFLAGWAAPGAGVFSLGSRGRRGGAGGGAAVSSLSSLAADPGSGQVRLSYDTLQRTSLEGRADDPDIRRLLVGALRDSLNAGLRLDAIDALRRATGETEVREALLKTILEDENAGARLKALEALRERAATDAEVREGMVNALLTDVNPGVRVRAVDILSRTRASDLQPVFERLSREDPNTYVRMRSAAALDDMVPAVRR